MKFLNGFKKPIYYSYFQVILEGVAGDGPFGDIAIDDTSFTPTCKLFTGKCLLIPTYPNRESGQLSGFFLLCLSPLF